MASAELPELVLPDSDAWREWLAAHHEGPAGVWLVLAKSGTTDPTTLTDDSALTEALCQGWIDGPAKRRDEATHPVQLTPRRARSQWSARNVGIVTVLMTQGRMQPSGMAQVAQAKADGRWDSAYGGRPRSRCRPIWPRPWRRRPRRGRCSTS